MPQHEQFPVHPPDDLFFKSFITQIRATATTARITAMAIMVTALFAIHSNIIN